MIPERWWNLVLCQNLILQSASISQPITNVCLFEIFLRSTNVESVAVAMQAGLRLGQVSRWVRQAAIIQREFRNQRLRPSPYRAAVVFIGQSPAWDLGGCGHSGGVVGWTGIGFRL